MSGLIYVGDGSYLLGIPARDLTEAEVEVLGKEKLLSTGLYEEPKTPPKKRKPSSNKSVTPPTENKEG